GRERGLRRAVPRPGTASRAPPGETCWTFRPPPRRGRSGAPPQWPGRVSLPAPDATGLPPGRFPGSGGFLRDGARPACIAPPPREPGGWAASLPRIVGEYARRSGAGRPKPRPPPPAPDAVSTDVVTCR